MGGEDKPTGIIVLTVLYVIEGLYGLAAGAAMFGGNSIFNFGMGSAILSAVGAITVIIGLIDLLIAYGLWELKSWARTAAIVLAIIGLLGFPIGTIISIIILWYLFKPEIKEAFKA
ncbi:MAG: hypothetical protein J7K61_03280 [Thermoplasmata archaeon]|nr:hypothetical protein [Thermoplasmata archaeon]